MAPAAVTVTVLSREGEDRGGVGGARKERPIRRHGGRSTATRFGVLAGGRRGFRTVRSDSWGRPAGSDVFVLLLLQGLRPDQALVHQVSQEALHEKTEGGRCEAARNPPNTGGAWSEISFFYQQIIYMC